MKKIADHIAAVVLVAGAAVMAMAIMSLMLSLLWDLFGDVLTVLSQKI